MTVRKIREQIDQSDRHEREKIQREHRADRATLPLALSGLCEAVKQMALELDKAKQLVAKQGYTKEFSPPAPPAEHISELKAVLSTTDERSVVEPISEAIRQIQTLWARVEVLSNKTEQRRRAGLTQNINSWILQSSEIYALIEALFEYARSESDFGPSVVTVERVESFIFRNHLEDKEISDEMKRMLEKSPIYWSLD